MQRRQSGRAAPGTIFGRAFRQTLIGATVPNRNSVCLKNDIVSTQCPCIQLDTETCFRSTSVLRKYEHKDGLRKKRQDEGQSHLHS